VKVSLQEASEKVLVVAVVSAERNEVGIGGVSKVCLCAE
jgi:hypothetical protein